MANPTLTADGTVTLNLLLGRTYTFAAGGTFGGGSLAAVQLLDDDTPVPVPGSPFTAAGQITLTAAASRLRLTLTGSTTPAITYNVNLASDSLAGASALIEAERTAAATLSGKRIPPRITTLTSSATPTVNTDNCDMVTITALAVDITSMTSGLTGTPNNGEMLLYRIKDDGTARAITWGASFAAAGAALPTTTVLGKVLHVLFIWDSVAAKWCCLSTAQEA